MGTRDVRSEHGQSLVLVLLLLPVIVLIGALAVDAANWFVHKRNVQIKADAAAFAGADAIRDGLLSHAGCVDATVAAGATTYAALNTHPGDPVAEARTAPNVRINAANYATQSTPGDAGLSGSPCTDKVVDVKVSELGLPWFLDITKSVDAINAQARVSLQPLSGGQPTLPVMVEDPTTKTVGITLVDKSDGSTLASRTFTTSSGTSNGQQLWGGALPAVAVTASRIGVRVALSRKSGVADCADAQVTCYDDVQFIRGWATPAVTGTAEPAAGDVHLNPATCAPSAYFSAGTASCTVALAATVAFNATPKDATKSDLVWATIGGSDHALTQSPTDPTSWSAVLPVAATAGAQPITLKWEQQDGKVDSAAGKPQTCDTKNANPCKGSIEAGNQVQGAFSASQSASGPITFAQVNEASAFYVNSVQRCATCTHTFSVQIGVKRLSVSQVGDAPVSLRVGANGQGTQSINCDPIGSPGKSQTDAQLGKGCPGIYKVNTGEDCSGWDTSRPTLWPCVQIQGASQPSKVADGMNWRINGSVSAACVNPQHWPAITPGDPRILPAFIVPLGSSQLGDGSWAPITEFAYFYVTGWSGSGGNDDPCPGDDHPADKGSIVGYYVKNVDTSGGGATGDGTACDFNDLGGCVAVMTK